MDDARVKAEAARVESEIAAWATGAAIADVMLGAPAGITAMARAMRTDTRSAYAGLDTDEDGGWVPTIFVTERLSMPVSCLTITATVS